METTDTTTGGVSRLTITPLQKNVTLKDPNVSLDTGNAMEVQFNPETMSLSKSNYWHFMRDLGDDVPEVIFSGGLAGTLEVDLLFDTTDTGGDVRKSYEKLVTLSAVEQKSDATASQPKHIMVQWGEFISFICVVDSFRQEFMLFKKDGTPLRANVHVCFKEAWSDKKKGAQNPTSRSDARRTWIVEQGQRLDWIAYREYGDSAMWRHIAETNGILDPLSIRPGQILKLVPLT